jgi:hypothetical protein
MNFENPLQNVAILRLPVSFFQMLPEKDFAAEVRAFRDLEAFLKDAVIVLDLAANDAREIVGSMLRRLLAAQQKGAEQFNEDEVMSACFTSHSGA